MSVSTHELILFRMIYDLSAEDWTGADNSLTRKIPLTEPHIWAREHDLRTRLSYKVVTVNELGENDLPDPFFSPSLFHVVLSLSPPPSLSASLPLFAMLLVINGFLAIAVLPPLFLTHISLLKCKTFFKLIFLLAFEDWVLCYRAQLETKVIIQVLEVSDRWLASHCVRCEAWWTPVLCHSRDLLFTCKFLSIRLWRLHVSLQ